MSQYELKVDIKSMITGAPIEVPPFGIFDNRGAAQLVQLNDDDAESYAAIPGVVLKKTGDDVADIETSGLPRRVDDLEASKPKKELKKDAPVVADPELSVGSDKKAETERSS